MLEADRAAIRYALEHPAPRLAAYDVAVMSSLFQALDAVWAGRATVEEALVQAQVEAEKQVAAALVAAAAAPTPPPVLPIASPTPQQASVVVTFFAGERSASEALGAVQSRAEQFVACLGVPGAALAERAARACARQVDPDYAW